MMKKIYAILVAILVSAASMAQVSSVTVNGSAKAEWATIACTQGQEMTISFDYPTTHAATSEPVHSVLVNVSRHDKTNGWSVIESEAHTVNGTSGSVTDFKFNMPTDETTFPVPGGPTTEEAWLIQIRVWYGSAAGNAANGDTYYNMSFTLAAGTTDIYSPSASAGSVYVSGKVLNINDAKVSSYSVYNLSGSVVQSGSIEGSSVQIPLSLAKGIYIVKVGNTTTKISL